MSFRIVQDRLGRLNSALDARFRAGQPVRYEVDGKPTVEVVSFRPFAYEDYGRIRNRAPYVVGELALRCFMAAPCEDESAVIFAGLQAESRAYGFDVDVVKINEVALLLGQRPINLVEA
jgi:hypothetical protein